VWTKPPAEGRKVPAEGRKHMTPREAPTQAANRNSRVGLDKLTADPLDTG